MDVLQQQSKVVVRAPSLKRGRSEEGDRFQLEHVMGVTVNSNSALVSDSNSHLVAYPSGCTVVLYNSQTCVQQAHIINTSRKTITALAFSSDGRYLATGECGHMPYVRIWDLQDITNTTQIAEFQGHQYGINCVAFSPSNKYVVSIGSQHDMIVNVWDWKNHVKIASNKVSTKIKGVCFAQDGSYFVTVGNRHVKFWYLEYTRNTKYKEAVPLVGRAAILGSQRGQNFVGVACGKGECADSTYVVTKSGLLCQLNNRRLLDKWLELRTASASSMAVGEKYIFVGCADGIVRCFDPLTLSFVTTLPRTHHLGVDVSLGTNISHMSIHPPNAKYPDSVALTYDEVNHKLTSIYNDHSIYVWDVREVRRVGKSQSFLYHSACIWGIEMLPTREEISRYRNPSKDTLPESCFVTCSSDDTIRIWNLDGNHNLGNIYSNELLKIIYMDPDLNYIKDQDQTLTGSNDKVDISYDGKNGVRCLRIRPDAIHLAAGDRAGNIKIFDLRTMKEMYKIEAHDAEVLCLEYSRNGKIDDSESSITYPRLLASASRDRLIHVFNVDDHYKILQTLDDHSSSITAVRFINIGDQFRMISCGADKSIIFRNLMIGNGQSSSFVLFQRDHNIAGRTTLYDMEVDTHGRHILTACQDRTVRLYSTRSGHYVRSMRGSPSEDGSLIKVTLNSSGRYMATSCTDKTLAVYCYWSGQLLACVSGHSELATGLKFTKNSDRLVSAGGDASILLWKHTKQKKPLVISSSGIDYEGDEISSLTEGFDPSAAADTSDYGFNAGPLPLWAKKQINEDSNSLASLTKSVDLPKGRWAQRVEQSGITVRSVFDSDSIIPFPDRQDLKQDSDGSKDSSIDSGTESRNYPEYRKESTIKFKQQEEEIIKEFVDNPENLSGINNLQTYSSHHTMILNRNIGTMRHHPNTDDSSLGSMLGGSSALGGDTCEDSTAEHDGDVEDCSDVEQKKNIVSLTSKLQFPEVNADSPSEYTVNAMSVEELRKSQRKSKNKRDLPLISISTTSVSGSQESDFDDDDASTPSGDNTDKNPISLLSGSTESLDTIATRGKYLQSAFDSLSGIEQDLNTGKTTLSSLHHTTRTSNGIPPRNIPLVNETKQNKYENDALRKREELNRRIEETRLKLQSVGYKSNLRASQSVLDLCPKVPESKQKSTTQRTTLYGNKNNHPMNESNKLQHNASHSNTNNMRVNRNDFNIPANINIKNNFKTLPFFTTRNYETYGVLSTMATATAYNDEPCAEQSLYDMIINKFNEDMRHLVLQTENNDSFPTINKSQQQIPTVSTTTATIASVNIDTTDDKPSQKNYVSEIRQKIESNIQNQNTRRPNLLNLNSENNNNNNNLNANTNSIYKKHKSLPVSPVTEEAKLNDYCYYNQNSRDDYISSNIDLSAHTKFDQHADLNLMRIQNNNLRKKNYSFFIDLNDKSNNKMTNVKKDDDEDNFSSDSLEECTNNATNRIKKYSKVMAESRRCVSNYDIFQQHNSQTHQQQQHDDDIIYDKNFYTTNIPRSSSALLKRVVTAHESNESLDSNGEQQHQLLLNYDNTSNNVYNNNDNELSHSRESVLSINELKSEPAIEPYNIYPEYERHSSASFYLRNANVPTSLSQESILSNFSDSADYSWKMNEEYNFAEKLSRTNCNSLESVLSDESVDTQSAPLEILFRTHRRRKASDSDDKLSENLNKIPTTTPPSIEQNYVQRTLMKFEPEHKLVTRSKSFQETSRKNEISATAVQQETTTGDSTSSTSSNVIPIANPDFIPNIQELEQRNIARVPLRENINRDRDCGNIPTLQNKNDQYEKQMGGSDFWTGNKIVAKSKSCSFEVFFNMNSSSPTSSNIVADDQNYNDDEYYHKNATDKLFSKTNFNKMNNTTKSLDRNKTNASRDSSERDNIVNIQKNDTGAYTTQSLDRNGQSIGGNRIKRDRGFESFIGDIVKHKPPKGIRRSISTRIKNKTTGKNLFDERRNSDSNVTQIKKKHTYEENNSNVGRRRRDIENTNNAFTIIDYSISDEKSVNLHYFEPSNKMEVCDENQQKEFPITTPSHIETYYEKYDDPNVAEREFENISNKNAIKLHKIDDYHQFDLSTTSSSPPPQDTVTIDPVPSCSYTDKSIHNFGPIHDMKYLSNEDIVKFRDIERKIEIINKLVEIEEQKITKGKVKRLSKNFERIAREQQQSQHSGGGGTAIKYFGVKRNLSLPEIANTISSNCSTAKPANKLFKPSKLPIKIATATTTATATESPSISTKLHSGGGYNKTRCLLDLKPLWPPATRCPQTKMINQKLTTTVKKHINSNNNNNNKQQETLIKKNSNGKTETNTKQKQGSVPPNHDDIDSETGLRRACSLSDLTDPTPIKQKSSSLSSAKIMHKPTPRSQQQTVRGGGSGGGGTSSTKTNMLRSSSVGVLNQSESESEIVNNNNGNSNNVMQPPKSSILRSNLMRPTISSQNKMANPNKINLRRRALQSSYSTANLTMVGQDDSSSDDQQQQIKNGTKITRNRSHSIDHTGSSIGLNLWNQTQRRNKENIGLKSRSIRNTSGLSDRTNTDTPRTDSDVDLTNSELTAQLCNKIAEQLTRTADNVVQLYRRLTLNDTSPEQSTNNADETIIDKSHMMKNLESAMLETQKILQLAVKQQQQEVHQRSTTDGNSINQDSSSNDAMISHNNLRELVALSASSASSGGGGGNNTNQANVVLMMQQYSDILLNMMQQKMQQKQS